MHQVHHTKQTVTCALPYFEEMLVVIHVNCNFSSFLKNQALFADSRKWLMEEWVDYLTPQIYWEITVPSDWWLNQNPKARHLYPGCATYKIVNSNLSINELQTQVR